MPSCCPISAGRFLRWELPTSCGGSGSAGRGPASGGASREGLHAGASQQPSRRRVLAPAPLRPYGRLRKVHDMDFPTPLLPHSLRVPSQPPRLLHRHEIHFISDEIYALSIFTDEDEPSSRPPFRSVLSLPHPDPDRTHVLWGLSKVGVTSVDYLLIMYSCILLVFWCLLSKLAFPKACCSIVVESWVPCSADEVDINLFLRNGCSWGYLKNTYKEIENNTNDFGLAHDKLIGHYRKYF